MSDQQLAEDIALAKHVARKVWKGLGSVLGMELEEMEGDALLALVTVRRAWEELGEVAQHNFGDRGAFIWIGVRRDLVDTIRSREGRQFKRARFRMGMTSLQRPVSEKSKSMRGEHQVTTVADVTADRRSDTHSQALARVDILGFDPSRMSISPGSGYHPARTLPPDNKWIGEAMARWGHTGLSARERECLWHLANGRGREQTALVMGVSIDTVKTFVRKAYSRLGANNAAHAVHLAHTLGVFEGLVEATPEGGAAEEPAA